MVRWQETKEILLGMVKVVFKRRRHWMTLCVMLQIAAYTMYYLRYSSGTATEVL